MRTLLKNKLINIEQIIDDGLTAESTSHILTVLGYTLPEPYVLDEVKLYSEYIPDSNAAVFTDQQRFLHFLWDAFEKLPLSVITQFSILFRRIIAKRLFAGCGDNFISNANVRFNYGQNLNIGNDVYISRGVQIDSRGDVVLGNSVRLAEGVCIYTGRNSETANEDPSSVVIGNNARIYQNVSILPGVTIGENAIVVAGSIVTNDIPASKIAAGTPAGIVQDTQITESMKAVLEYIWLTPQRLDDIAELERQIAAKAA